MPKKLFFGAQNNRCEPHVNFFNMCDQPLNHEKYRYAKTFIKGDDHPDAISLSKWNFFSNFAIFDPIWLIFFLGTPETPKVILGRSARA